jgi:hypothetical protein
MFGLHCSVIKFPLRLNALYNIKLLSFYPHPVSVNRTILISIHGMTIILQRFKKVSRTTSFDAVYIKILVFFLCNRAYIPSGNFLIVSTFPPTDRPVMVSNKLKSEGALEQYWENNSDTKFDNIVLVMEAVKTSETSVNFYETTRRNIPEGCHLLNSITV